MLNSITAPSNALGFAECDYMGLAPGSSYRTFYTTINNEYWYYDGTTWLNTAHSVGNTAAVNIAGGGGYIFNLVGATGQIYKYDGTGNGSLMVIQLLGLMVAVLMILLQTETATVTLLNNLHHNI